MRGADAVNSVELWKSILDRTHARFTPLPNLFPGAAAMIFRKDPCGITCLVMTYGAVMYADYVVVRWIVMQTMQVGKKGWNRGEVRMFLQSNSGARLSSIYPNMHMSVCFDKFAYSIKFL